MLELIHAFRLNEAESWGLATFPVGALDGNKRKELSFDIDRALRRGIPCENLAMQEEHLLTRVQATYSVEQADLYEAQVRHAGLFFRLLQGFGVVLICVGLGSVASGEYSQTVIPVLLGSFFLLRMRLAVRAAYRRDFVPAVETTITVSDSGVQFQNEKGHTDFAWSAFVRYTETKTLFMLYVQSRIFQVVPKRAFSANELGFLREVLQGKIGTTSVARNVGWPVAVLGVITILAFILVVWAVHSMRATH